MSRLVTVFLMITVATLALTACSEETNLKLEAQYLAEFDEWVEEGAKINEVQERLANPCSKLYHVTSGRLGAEAMALTGMSESDTHIDVCVRLTIHRVYPQPELLDQGTSDALCDGASGPYKRLCELAEL